MKNIFTSLFDFFVSCFRSRISMQLEILALRHQLGVCQRSVKRVRIKPADRLFWSCFSKLWFGWRDVLVFVRPETVIAWQRRRFREYWTRLSRSGKPGRPKVAKEIRELIRKLSQAKLPDPVSFERCNTFNEFF